MPVSVLVEHCKITSNKVSLQQRSTVYEIIHTAFNISIIYTSQSTELGHACVILRWQFTSTDEGMTILYTKSTMTLALHKDEIYILHLVNQVQFTKDPTTRP